MAKAAARRLSPKKPSLDEAKAYIEALDLTPMIERVMKEKRWTRRMAETAAHFYRNYLFLVKKYGDDIPTLGPTKQMDEIWHAHILYTRDYRAFCEKVFGGYLDHQPNSEDHEMTGENLNILLSLHEKEFGEPIYETGYSLKDLYLNLTALFKKIKFYSSHKPMA